MNGRFSLRSQAGFTLVEVLVAWTVLLAALVSTFSVFSNSQAETANAQRRGIMSTLAQREIEQTRALPPANVALSRAASTAAEGLPTGKALTETRVVDAANGRVDPGPTAFTSRGMTFRIYRYVTLNSAVCGAATAAIAAQIDIQAGTTGASGSLNDLCPATGNTKRVTVVVVADYPDTKTHLPVQSATLMADTATVQVAATGTGLRVNTTGLNSTGTSQTEPEKTYANAQNQTLYLYDTPCNQWNSHQPVNADHPTNSTAEAGKVCNGSGSADLLGTTTPPAVSRAFDYSSDLVRTPVDGLALKKDPTSGTCSSSGAQSYSSSEASTRKWSLHRWSTKPLSAQAQTLSAGGQATLTLFTHSVGAASGSGRICATIRRASDGAVLGSADYFLADWPQKTTQLDLNFDLAYATLASNDRLEILLRAHPSSDNDIELLYDRADAPSSVTLTMAQGKAIS